MCSNEYVGGSKRYRAYYDARMDEHTTEILIRPTPMSLTPEELDVEHDPVSEAREPIAVRAWVRYGDIAARADGHAVAWNSRAVHVRWRAIDGSQRSAWVWASAVDRK